VADYVPVVVPEALLADGSVPPPPLKMLSAHFVMEDCDGAAHISALGVIPRSHLSGRAPNPTESSWNGNRAFALGAKAGDVVLLRCDTWRVDSPRAAAAG
jgi:hypothetical protein